MERVGVHSNCEILHENYVPWVAALLVRACSQLDLVCSQDLSNSCWALLIEWPAHVLKVWLGKLMEHPHLIWIDDFHDILLIIRPVKLRFGLATRVVLPEWRLEHLLVLRAKWATIELSQSLEVRRIIKSDTNIYLVVEEGMDLILVSLTHFFVLILILIGLVYFPRVLEHENLLDDVVVQIMVKLVI